MVVRDLNDRLPTEARWLVNKVQFRRRPTVICDIEPVIFLEAICRLVFIITKGNLADSSAAFHLNKSDVGECLVVVRMRFPRDDIKSAIVLFYALNHPTTLGLVPDHGLDSNPLDLLIANHGCD